MATNQQDLKPLQQGESNAALLNRPIFLLSGLNPGYVKLIGFTGTYYDDKGASSSTGNPVLYLLPGAAVPSIQARDSANATNMLLVNDNGITTTTATATTVVLGPTPATTGSIRLTNNTGAYWRNAANSANVAGILVNASDNLLLGDAANSPSAYLQALTDVRLHIGANDRVVVDATNTTLTNHLKWSADNTYDIGGSGANRPHDLLLGNSAIVGATPAVAGAIRLTNNTNISWRGVGAYDVVGVLVNASDNLLLGDVVRTPSAYLQALTDVRLHIGANDRVVVDATNTTLTNHIKWSVDNTYDIGGNAANRPHDLFLGHNATVGGTVVVTGAVTAGNTYTDFVPALSQGATPTYTVTLARYLLFGKMAHAHMIFTLTAGTPGTAATAVQITLPNAIQAAAAGGVMGIVAISDVSVGTLYEGVAFAATATNINGYAQNSTLALGAGSAFTAALAVGDVIRLDLVYEIL